MNDRPETAQTYRPWTMVTLSGLGLAAAIVFIGRTVWTASQGGNWSQIRFVIPALVVGALLAWAMSNRLKVWPDRIDSRYMWQKRIVNRDEVAYVHDVRPIGGAISVTFVLKDDSAVSVTWSGQVGRALVAWAADLPQRDDESPES